MKPIIPLTLLILIGVVIGLLIKVNGLETKLEALTRYCTAVGDFQEKQLEFNKEVINHL